MKIWVLFVQASGKINTSPTYRLLIFFFVALMTVVSAVLDVAITPCMAESPRVSRHDSCERCPRRSYQAMHGREPQGKSP